MKASITRPDEADGIYRYNAVIETPDGEALGIFAYERDAVRWIKKWCEDRGLPQVEIRSYGTQATGGEYLIKA